MKGAGLTSARKARGSGRRLRLPGTQRRTAALLAEPERVSGEGPVLPLRGALPCSRAIVRAPRRRQNPEAVRCSRCLLSCQGVAEYSGCWDRACLFSTAVRTGFRRKDRWRVWGRLGIGSQKSEVAPKGAWRCVKRSELRLRVGGPLRVGSIKIAEGRKMKSVSP